MSKIQKHIDLNCDLGEGYPHDGELMKLISSANIACGGHFGDADTMKRTIDLALENDVAIGAHPSYPDQANFGRKSMNIGIQKLSDSILSQIDSISKIAASVGTKLSHVKPHGALYNDSAKDSRLAAMIAETVAKYDDSLVLFGLANSVSIDEARNAGIRTCGEAFADRTYRSDGSLAPRTGENAFVTSSLTALTNILQLLDTQTLTATTGEILVVDVQTICIHGDGPNALEFAETIYRGLSNNGIEIGPKYVR